MGVKNDITIIRLILGHWAGKLSEPEKKELDNWLAQSEKHRIYFQKWCDDERQNELLSKIGCYDPGEGGNRWSVKETCGATAGGGW